MGHNLSALSLSSMPRHVHMASTFVVESEGCLTSSGERALGLMELGMIVSGTSMSLRLLTLANV